MKTHCILICCVLLFGCRKYPENKVWFKNPEKIEIFDRTCLKKYQVNGIDSLDAMNSYIDPRTRTEKQLYSYAFTMETAVFRGSYKTRNGTFGGSQYSNTFRYTFTKDKKKLRVAFEPSGIFNKNLFISPYIEWNIIHLSKSGEITLEYAEDGNAYHIEIGHK